MNKTLRLLARIMDEAVEYGHVAVNPARGRNRRLRVKTPRRIWLELDEVRSLLDAAASPPKGKPGYRGELATLIFAGLRISELGSLRWRAVDFGDAILTVEQWHKSPTAGLEDLVFPTGRGRQRDRSNSRGRLATILKRANVARAEQGLPPISHVTNHTLRRTFASLMYEAGAQPTDVMAAMGHRSAKLALEVYARKMQRDRETAKRMEALVWAQTGTSGDHVSGDVAAVDSVEERNPAL